MDILKKIFPFLNWFENYNTKTLHYDLISGITVALIVIPQSMAYAQLAGLPTYYGLYASFLPTIFASFFGSSNQLSTGPTAVVSLMTAVALEPLATAGSEAYITYAILLAFTVGAFRLSLGVLKLGLIINFLPLTVVNGYTSAAAIIIASSQLRRIFGVYVASSHYQYQTVINIVKSALEYTHMPTLYMAIFSFILMYVLKKYFPKIPFVLAAVIITTIISWAIGYEHNLKININDIQYPEAVNMIKRFDKDMELLKINSSKRASLKDKIEAMKSADTNTIKIVDEEYYASLLGVKISKEKHETHILRDDLNSLKFQAINSSGKLVFYKYGSVTEDLDDGRIWRLKVRNSELNIENITMMGGGIVVGDIPKGLPSFVMPDFDLSICLKFLPMAAIISLLGFIETISIGKSIAVKTGQKIDPNQELIGQGIANIVGAFGQSYPVSGSFSRSAVNFQSGGKTGISSFVTSIIIVLVLFFFTPLLYYLPKVVLASIIMMAVIGLVNIKSCITAWRSRWYDGVISIVTLITTLAFAPHLEIGIATGIVLSLIVYLYNSMRPRIVTLSMAPDFSLRSANKFNLQECGYIAALRVEGSIFFASSTYLDDVIDDIMRKKKKLRHFLIVCNGVNDMDYTGVYALEQVINKVRTQGYGISFSGLNDKVLHLLKKTKLIDLIGKEHIYPTMAEAIEDLFYKTHEEGATNVLACPLLNYLPKGSNKIFEIN